MTLNALERFLHLFSEAVKESNSNSATWAQFVKVVHEKYGSGFHKDSSLLITEHLQGMLISALKHLTSIFVSIFMGSQYPPEYLNQVREKELKVGDMFKTLTNS